MRVTAIFCEQDMVNLKIKHLKVDLKDKNFHLRRVAFSLTIFCEVEPATPGISSVKREMKVGGDAKWKEGTSR